MDIEQLNKSQIVLLTLLVSFMTSIATGIVTVALMQQAPPAITQTVNRVIEHTIEKVVPGQAASVATVISKPTIISTSDAIATAVGAASPSLVRLYTSDAAAPKFLGLGLVLDSDGTIVTDASALGESPDAVAELSNSTRVRVFVKARDTVAGTAYLAPGTPDPAATPPVWKPATLSSGHSVLGQTVIALSGRTTVRLGQGIITAAGPLADSAPDGPQVLETNVRESDIIPGSPLINTDGAIIGVSTSASRTSSSQGFVSASALTPLPAKESAPAHQ